MSLSTDSSIPGLAIICNSVPPYRAHVHRRIVNELREVRLWTVCTHEGTDARWPFNPPPEINTVSFGLAADKIDRPGINYDSYRKGGEIIEWMKLNNIQAVVVLGYNDIGRLRIIRWCRRNGIPCFIWADANIRLDRHTGIKALGKYLIVSTILSWLSGALVCGRYGRQYFERYGVPSSHIFHFPNEPDYSLIRDISPARLRLTMDRYRFQHDRRRLVFSGRLIDIKRVDLLIDAFTAIAAERPQWDLVIIGDGPLRKSLEARVPATLAHRVTWLGFLSDQGDVSAIYRVSDILVLPSDFDQWALVLNEAAAAKMAIVCTDVVGAAAELVREGINGCTFPPGDLDRLKACLIDVTNLGRIDSMKNASGQILRDWETSADPITGLRQALQHVRVI